MDQEISVPLGWSRTVQNGRALYISPPPFPVKIYSQTDLALYQKKGRFLDIMEDQLVFGRKRKKKEKKLGEFTMVSQPIRLILVDWFVFNFFWSSSIF